MVAIDASKINLPIDFAFKKYRKPGKQSFYPQGMVSTVYDVMTNLPVSAEFCRHANERQAALQNLKYLDSQDIVTFDRGYMSGKLLQHLKNHNLHGILRVPTKSFKEFNPAWKGKKEHFVHLRRTQNGLDIHLRLLRYTVKGSTILLATTLLDSEQYPAKSIRKIYGLRWNIEEGYKSLKNTLHIEEWHSHSSTGVKQELFISFIVLFLTRLLELMDKKQNAVERTKPSQPVCHKVVQTLIESAMPEEKIPLSEIKRLRAITRKSSLKTKLNRSFKRISKAPIGKFQLHGDKRAKGKIKGISREKIAQAP